ncbi:MAG: hypothetical protein ABIO60_06710 [Aquaticitalea sp.]
MKQLIHLFFCFSISAFSQETVEAKFIKSTEIELQSIVDIDNFGIIYLVNKNVFHKIDTKKDVTYSNVQLGKITSADAFNSLKINLFYKNFNTAIILDNRLAEIYKIDFNTVQPYKNVSHISTGADNTIWIFNTDLQQLELFDYKTNKTRATALPVQSNVLDMVSNYNNCWLLTEKFLYQYNYFGSLVSKQKNDGFTKISEDNGNLVIQQHEKLLFLPKDSERTMAIPFNGLLINQFLVTNETLYIYDSKKLHQYQLKIE